MLPNLYIHEELAKMDRQERLRQAEHDRLLRRQRRAHPGRAQHLIGSLSTCLVWPGTRMKQQELPAEHAV